jgi:hypothetical protein
MLVTELFEYNAWYGPDDQWYSQSTDPWYDGNDQWHGSQSGNMIENHDTTNSEFSDIVTARQLIGAAMGDPLNEKHKYFEFLKYIRTKHGADYSTRIHKKAAELARAKV